MGESIFNHLLIYITRVNQLIQCIVELMLQRLSVSYLTELMLHRLSVSYLTELLLQLVTAITTKVPIIKRLKGYVFFEHNSLHVAISI